MHGIAGRGMRRAAAATAVIAIGATLAACGGDSDSGSADSGGSDEKVTLKFSYFTSEKNPIGETWNWWMDEVTKRTDGAVTFDAYWDGTLLKADEVVDGLKDGRADIAQITPTFFAGKFPRTAIAELPFTTPNVAAISKTMAKLATEDEGLSKEWSSQGLRPLAWNVGASSGTASTKKIDSAADLKGLKVRGIDRGSRALKANGANVIALAPAELYTSLDRGVLDAVYGVQFGALTSLKLDEVADYVTDLGVGAQTASSLTMSQTAWDKLSEEHQKVITEISAEVPKKYGEINAAADEASCKVFTEKKTPLFALPDAEVEKIKAKGEKTVRDEWAAEVKKAGGDPVALQKTYDAAVAEAQQEFPDWDVSGLKKCIASQGGA